MKPNFRNSCYLVPKKNTKNNIHGMDRLTEGREVKQYKQYKKKFFSSQNVLYFIYYIIYAFNKLFLYVLRKDTHATMRYNILLELTFDIIGT